MLHGLPAADERPKLLWVSGSKEIARKAGQPTDTKPVDVALVHARTEDGKGLHILRQRGNRLEAGVARPMKEGKPIQGELISMARRKDSPVLFDVQTIHRSSPSHDNKNSNGPARVTGANYRSGWERVFGTTPGRRAGGELN